MWKNFFGMIGARSPTSASARRLAAGVARQLHAGVAALVELEHRGDAVDRDDLLAVEHSAAIAAVGRAEGDESHALASTVPQTRAIASA